MVVVRDPDGYMIQLLSQDFDKYEELKKACADVVLDGAEKAMEDIRLGNDPETLAEAGLATEEDGVGYIDGLQAPHASPI